MNRDPSNSLRMITSASSLPAPPGATAAEAAAATPAEATPAAAEPARETAPETTWQNQRAATPPMARAAATRIPPGHDERQHHQQRHHKQDDPERHLARLRSPVQRRRDAGQHHAA